MPKLTRVLVRQFGASGSATNFGQFGSKFNAAPQTSQNPSVIMALANWLSGWTQAAVGARFNPYLEDMNGFCYTVFYFLANIFERGIPDWDATTTYFKGAVCQDPAGSGQYFYSLTDNNLNQALPLGASNAQWRWLNAPQVPVGTVLDFCGISLPTDYDWADGLALDRTVYATLLALISITRNGTLASGSAIVTGLSSTSDLKAGWPMSGTGVATGAKILTVDSPTQVTMTAVATGSGVQALLFAPFGVGDGTTTFNKPSFARRVAVGAGGAGTATLGNALAATGGEEAHVMVEGELAPHHHQFPQPLDDTSAFAGGSNDGRRHATTLVDTEDTGDADPMNVMQPSLVVNKIIKVR
jgi:microcystin-dependent protein